MEKIIQLDFRSRIKKIRLRLLVFLWVRLHPKISDSLRLWLCNLERNWSHWTNCTKHFCQTLF